MRIYKTRLAKTKYHTYIVRSDIEGADVLFDGINVGQISNGVYYHKIKESEDTGTHTIQLQNGTLPVEEVHYAFIHKQNFTIDANGDRIVFNNSNIESEKITTIYSSNDIIKTLTIENNICTILARRRELIDNLSFRPTYYDVPANETKDNKTYSVTLYQDESNERLTVTISQQAGTEHTYTVNSDIEGAIVIAGSEIVGTINNGTCRFTKWNSKATDLSITLSGGTLVTKEDGYTFEVATPTKNVSADGGIFDVSTIVTSLVGSYTPKYPSAKICHPNSSITINTEYDYDTVDAPYTAVGQVTFTENETTNPISREITITQDDTGAQEKVTITQEAGIRHTYTIVSDCNGAQVNIDGINRGTISGGQFVYSVWNSKAPANVSVYLTGGLPTAPSPDYTFNVSQSSLSFGEDGGTKSLTISSTKVTYSYSNTNGICQRDSSITCNAKLNRATSNPSYSASESLSWITTSGNQVTASANSNYNSRSGTITYTQAESGKTDTVNVSQEAKTEYTYTVNSNCNGGTVYFNNVRKGTISGGRLVFTDEASSGTVRISGGVPSNSVVDYDTRTNGQDSDYETRTNYEYNFEYNNFSGDYMTSHGVVLMPDNGDSDSYPVWSARGATTQRRYRYRDILQRRDCTRTYSAPSNKTINGGGSVTMNYTYSDNWGSWYNNGYGSWGSYYSWSNYGSTSWSKDQCNLYSKPSWLNVNISNRSSGSGSSQGYDVRFTTNSENRDSLRYGNVVLTNSQGTRLTLRVNQNGYIFYLSKQSGTFTHPAQGGTNAADGGYRTNRIWFDCYYQYDTIDGPGVKGQCSINMTNKPSWCIDYWAVNGTSPTGNPGWFIDYTCQTNDSTNSRSGNCTMVNIGPAGAGWGTNKKSLNVTITQQGASLKVTSTSNIGNLNVGTVITNGATYLLDIDGVAHTPTFTANKNVKVTATRPSTVNSVIVNGSGTSKFSVAMTTNRSFGNADSVVTVDGGTLKFTLRLGGRPNEFTLNMSSYLTGYNYAISRSNVTSLNTTGTVPTIVRGSATKIIGVLNTNNSNAVVVPFTSYTSQQFKIWRRAGTSGSWTLYKTITATPNETTS